MIGQDHSYAEPEGIRHLRALVEGIGQHSYAQAYAQAKDFLRQIERGDTRPTGRQLRCVTHEQLREIARRALSQNRKQIAREMGVSRDLVQHHLKPSKAMRAACASAPEATAP